MIHCSICVVVFVKDKTKNMSRLGSNNLLGNIFRYWWWRKAILCNKAIVPTVQNNIMYLYTLVK